MKGIDVGTWQLNCEDVFYWAKRYDGLPFHALLTDAPYEENFMGKDWDSAGVSYQPYVWRALARHLLPGAFLLVFAGTLNDDLISVAMRQAGLRRFHKVIYWGYGQGFPKAAQVEVHNSQSEGTKALLDEWNGHRYGLQALKPAAETILVFQKAWEGDAVESIVRTGAGALNINGARIPGSYETRDRDINGGASMFGTGKGGGAFIPTVGRWPSNLVLGHLPDCKRVGTKRVKGSHSMGNCEGKEYDDMGLYEGNIGKFAGHDQVDPDGLELVDAWECEDNCPVKALGDQSGESKVNGRFHRKAKTGYGFGDDGYGEEGQVTPQYFDAGSAARFFFQATWELDQAEQLDAADALRYCAKSSRAEREAGLEGTTLRQGGTMDGGHVVSEGRQAPKTGRVLVHNPHPTIKPLTLCRYLATLLLPPAVYAPRRILVPFCGVASEMIGALLAGWDEVLGIDNEPEYIPIAEARLNYWLTRTEERP